MNAIELRGLTKSYTDFQLGPLDLTLPSGCIMGLIGENGAGKSTTIKLILDMIRRDSGEIDVLGRDNRTGFSAVKEDIGVVFGEAGMPECFSTAQVDKAMSLIYSRWDSRLFEGYLRKLAIPQTKPFKEFSTGMKMKLNIAIALSHSPKLLVLDEPTSGLDPVVRDEVVDIFLEFTRDENHSILISSHIVSDLEKLCDYIAFLHKGRLMLCEEKDELLAEYGLLRCKAEELTGIDPQSIAGKRETPYGVTAIVRRSAVADRQLSPISIEDLFIAMAKEG